MCSLLLQLETHNCGFSLLADAASVSFAELLDEFVRMEETPEEGEEQSFSQPSEVALR
jgi:hypothetical protein